MQRFAIALDHKSDCPETQGIIMIYIFIGLIENLSIKRKIPAKTIIKPLKALKFYHQFFYKLHIHKVTASKENQ